MTALLLLFVATVLMAVAGMCASERAWGPAGLMAGLAMLAGWWAVI